MSYELPETVLGLLRESAAEVAATATDVVEAVDHGVRRTEVLGLRLAAVRQAIVDLERCASVIDSLS